MSVLSGHPKANKLLFDTSPSLFLPPFKYRREITSTASISWTSIKCEIAAIEVFLPEQSISFLHFFAACSRCLNLDLHRSACLICLCCWLYSVFPQLRVTIDEREVVTDWTWTRSVIIIKIILLPIFQQIKSFSSWSTFFFNVKKSSKLPLYEWKASQEPLPIDDADVAASKRQKFVLQDLPGVGTLVHQVEFGQDADRPKPWVLERHF